MEESKSFTEMKKGNRERIEYYIVNGTGFEKAQAVLLGGYYRLQSQIFKQKLLELEESDMLALFKVRIADLATAALDCCGYKKYTGDDPYIKTIIENDMGMGWLEEED